MFGWSCVPPNPCPWIHTTRRWTLITWGFQTTGILLGAGWAYAVLGWGGYWAWDPVENASLLPWITSTAFLHSVMMQEKRGMMKVWNIVLVSATFFLCIFGTYITRSGIIDSVHAFGASLVGTFFLAFLIGSTAFSVALIVISNRLLKPEHEIEDLLSKEGFFLATNVLLVAMTAITLIGTMFPYMRQDQKDQPRAAINTAAFVRQMWAAGVQRLITMDVHNPAAVQNAAAALKMNFDHLEARCPLAKAVANPDYFLIVMFGWAHRLAVLLLPIMGLSLAFVYLNKRQYFIYDHQLVATNLLSFSFLTNALGMVLPMAAWPMPGLKARVTLFSVLFALQEIFDSLPCAEASSINSGTWTTLTPFRPGTREASR